MDKFNLYTESFSQVYDRFWNDFIDDLGPKIFDFHQNQINGKTEKNQVLDLCCGTGRLAKYLCQQNYSVTAIDKSPGMLKLAKEKLRNYIENGKALVIEANAEDFHLNRSFDLILSTFDSVNHLKNLDAVKTCFTQVYNHLESDGFFIFDMNPEEVLKGWNFIDLEESEDKTIIYIMHGNYKPGDLKAYTRVTGFVDSNADGNYQRFDEIMYNSIFKIPDIIDLIVDLGFNSPKLFDENFEHKLDLRKPIKERVFFVVTK